MIKKYEIPLEWLSCPVTKEPLSLDGSVLRSSKGIYSKDPNFGFWNFFPKDESLFSKSEWKTWEKLQQNGVVSYEADPTKNLGVGKRQDFLEFSEFAKFDGLILDIGVGPQASPSHIEHTHNPNAFFVGVDPLVGQQPRSFAFVQGLGEYLPFKDETFDQVLFVTSLDHFIDPLAPLREARRVVKKTGNVCIWLGEKDKNAPRPSMSPEWYSSLEVPSGAEDRFHFKRFTNDDFQKFALAANFKIRDQDVRIVDEWRKNFFYRLSV